MLYRGIATALKASRPLRASNWRQARCPRFYALPAAPRSAPSALSPAQPGPVRMPQHTCRNVGIRGAEAGVAVVTLAGAAAAVKRPCVPTRLRRGRHLVRCSRHYTPFSTLLRLSLAQSDACRLPLAEQT